jgi:RNA polymerase sigma-70 factor (ECF subfamily)
MDDLHEGRVPAALEDWTRRLAQGDEESWRWFHQRYYLPLLRYASQRVGNPSHASEVVQQSYLRVARHIRPFTSEGDFWNWLCCVVRCAAVDHGRTASRRLLLMEKFAHWRASHAPDHTPSPATTPAASALLDEALATLSGDEANLLRRKYCEGWSTQDLATELSTTPKAIESRLARLRERLREIILNIQ